MNEMRTRVRRIAHLDDRIGVGLVENALVSQLWNFQCQLEPYFARIGARKIIDIHPGPFFPEAGFILEESIKEGGSSPTETEEKGYTKRWNETTVESKGIST